MSAESSTLAWLPVLGGLALKSLIVFAVAGASLLALRRASASARHLVCLLTLAALLALPILSLALPGWRLAVLAAPAASREPAVDRTHPASETHPAAGGVGPPAPAHRASAAGTTGGRRASERESDMDVRSFPESPPLTGEGGEPQRAGRGSLPRPFPWAVSLTALWLGGVLLALLRPLLGLWGIARLSQGSTPVSDAPTLALASECASALGLSRMPILCQADAPVPMTWGWRRPVVLLPAEAPGWPADRLRAVLLHELAHVRRRDWLSHRFADLVCALYWFHPLVWPVARRLRAEGEIACDDLVLTSGVAAPDYARHLLDVARALRPISDAVPQAAIAMARTARLEGRLKMILDTTRPRRALSRRVLLLALTPGTAALVSLAMLRPSAKAQAAPLVMPAAAPAPPPHLLEGSETISRYSISPVPPPQLMKQEGNITWTPPRLVFLPKALPLGARIQGESTLKRLKTAPPKAAPRAARRSSAAVTSAAFDGLTVILPRGGSLSPLHMKAAHAAVFTSASKPAGSSRVVFSPDLTLNGTTLLAGMTEADKPGGSWWSASGAVLPTPVYDTTAYHAENHAGTDTHNVSFAIRLPASAQGLTVQYALPQSKGFSSDGFWPTKIQENETRTEAQVFAQTNGVRVLTAAFPVSLKKASLRVGIASGPWKTVATDTHDTLSEPAGYMSASPHGGSRFIFSPVSVPLSLTNSVVLSVSTDATDDLRVIAVDAQGKEVLPVLIGGNSIGALDQITARFSLPFAQIKEIRVETRPFQWVEIKDIALQPAQ